MESVSPPQSQTKIMWVVFGLIVSLAAAHWWHNELSAFAGERIGRDSFRCLLKIGMGDCAQLWLLGMHQTNQIASLLFYGGLALAFYNSSPKARTKLVVGVVLFILIISSLHQTAANRQNKIESTVSKS